MLEDALALHEAWTNRLSGFDLADTRTLVMGGVAAELTSESFPMPVADAVEGLVTLGKPAPALGDDATPSATGLAPASIDACVLLEAWSSPGELDAVVIEARRITRTDGQVWLGEVDIETLVAGTAGTQRSAAFYRARGEAPVARSGSVSPTSLALLRGRFGAIETSRVLLPMASFADADGYIGAVLAGMWFGVEDLSVAEKAQLERDLRRDLREERFPIVEYRPWVVSRGRKR